MLTLRKEAVRNENIEKSFRSESFGMGDINNTRRS
jgi:hypothetical protein